MTLVVPPERRVKVASRDTFLTLRWKTQRPEEQVPNIWRRLDLEILGLSLKPPSKPFWPVVES